MAPVLLAVAHGSRDPAAVTSTRALLRLVLSLRPELTVRCGFLDLSRPLLTETPAQLCGARPILVPLLLGTGYHIRVDLPAALATAGLPLTHPAPGSAPTPARRGPRRPPRRGRRLRRRRPGHLPPLPRLLRPPRRHRPGDLDQRAPGRPPRRRPPGPPPLRPGPGSHRAHHGCLTGRKRPHATPRLPSG
ncbi:sirohydrochlorin chelatase [Kitasatospora aureofaciens]|uniref:sirohydrochlorin chelatase n=1 Tax=Kitasatospora aureofaciens TaxID=1894 RepID=UPI0036F45273